MNEGNNSEDNISLNEDDLFNNKIDVDKIPWMILKYVFENNREQGYKIHTGDVFKLGKYILKVKEIGIENKKMFDRKRTQKFSKNKIFNISNNNLSQIPLNHNPHEDDNINILNLNININNNISRNNDINNKESIKEIKNDSNNNINIIKINSDNNNSKNNEINNSQNENNDDDNNNVPNIHIIDNENESGDISNSSYSNNNNNNNIKSNNNSNNNNNSSKKKSSNNIQNNNSISNKSNNSNININNFASVVNVNQENFINNNDINDNNNKNINNENYNISILNNKNNKIKNFSGENKNLYFINIIKNQNTNNSFGFNTFKNETHKQNSVNKSNHQLLKFSDTKGENENINRSSHKYLTLNSLTNNSQKIKNSIKELKSTASFNKKKVLDLIEKKILKSAEKSNKPICRICLSEEYEKANPLIHPCNCDGTMKYIHLECLKLLIQSKIKKTENDFCKILTFKRIECEICKTVFPEKISIKGSLYSIIDINKPEKDYIILEGIIKEIPEEKSVYIVHFKDKKEIKIGRATDANIRLNDISVSRAHATISLYNDNFYLHDTNSKFGTLIRMKNVFNILLNKPFFVQKGNIFFQFFMYKTFWAYFKCYRPKNIKYNNNYNDFFDEIFENNYYKLDDKYENNFNSLLRNVKTKSVSEYSSDNIKYNNKIEVKSMKNLNIYETVQKVNDVQIYKSNNENNFNEYNQQIIFDSFRFNQSQNNNQNNNNKISTQSLIINKTRENSKLDTNINHKNDLTKSKSKEEIHENDNLLELK